MSLSHFLSQGACRHFYFSYVMRTQVRGLDHFGGFADEYKPMMPKAQ